jgi:hypothetical protein
MRFDYHDFDLKSTIKIKDGSLWTSGRNKWLITARREERHMQVTVIDVWSDLGFITSAGVRASAFFYISTVGYAVGY